MTLHASHIKDWDDVRAGQYFFLGGSATNSTLSLLTIFKCLDGNASQAQMFPFLSNATALGAILQDESTITGNPIDIFVSEYSDDLSGFNTILSSRLIPNSVYLSNPSSVGTAYKQLLLQGIPAINGHLVAGGQVSANEDIDSAVLPAWRTAKTHIAAVQIWDDSLSAPDVLAFRRNFTATVRPVLSNLAGGPSSGSYSNEADVLEPNFQVTFYGSNYACLESIKAIYDPNDLFIVPTGVRSEYWDADGMCTV
jgi:hypothetical protein